MARKRRKLRPSDRSTSGASKKMSLTARITRRATTAGPYTEPYAFEACVRVAHGAANCGFGRNPRQALASALAVTASRLKKRKGAFRGVR